MVLGGGAAAFAAITEASERGLETAIVNTGLPLGGTCVNVGCVPSKHLLEVEQAAFEPPRNPFGAVKYNEEPTVDWASALDEKDRLVGQLRDENYVDVADSFGTDVYEGYGRFADSEARSRSRAEGSRDDETLRVSNHVSNNRTNSSEGTTIEVIDGADAGARVAGEKVLVATGSSPSPAPIDGLRQIDYETSESILERRTLPDSMVVIGGGYIALKWGQILHHVGVDVTMLQRSDHVLSGMERQLGREIERCFREEGIEIVTDVDVQRVGQENAVATDGGLEAIEAGVVETDVDGERRKFAGEDLFVATGVAPNSEGIGLDSVGIETDESGAIVVDECFQTTHPNVYGAGDVIGEPELETVAAKEGNHAVENAFRNEGRTIDYDAVPKVVFPSPEVAAVGITEAEYADDHGACVCRTVDMADVPKAKAVEDTRGLLQVAKHHETDTIVGVHMVGPRTADMIPAATLAVKLGLTVDDVIDMVHSFLIFSEALRQACQAFRRDTETMSCCIE